MTNADERTENDQNIEGLLEKYKKMIIEADQIKAEIDGHLLSEFQVEQKFESAFPELAITRKRSRDLNQPLLHIGAIAWFSHRLEMLPDPKIKKITGNLWLESDIDDFIAGLKALAPKDEGGV